MIFNMRAHEFIPEKINPETIEPGFERTRRMKNGYVIRARASNAYSDGGIEVQVFDVKDDPRMIWPIADVRFKVKADPDTGELFLSSLSTGTKERYRRQGLAGAMYNFARMLGNDIRASRLQTDQGRAFWQGGAGAGRPLELSDEPEYRSEPPPPAPEPPPPRPRGFIQRWKRLLMPDRKVAT